MSFETPTAPGYRVARRLGAGAMGTLWEAWDHAGRHVALKLADRGPRLGRERIRRQFRREAAAVLALDHPHLVRGLAVGETAEGTPFVALEFVEGETLTERIRRQGALAEREAVALGLALAGALEYAHARGLVHRDVKPDNVMLVEGGGVKLVDLGLAEESGLAAPGCGSPGYASPEMMTKGVVGPASDLWALGVLLATSVLGRPLFPGDTTQQVLKNAMHMHVSLPESVNGRSLSEHFRLVVERLLRKDPRERYLSAGQLRLDLEALREGDRPLAALLAARSRLAPRISRTHVAVGGGVALAGVVAVALFLQQGPRPEGDHDLPTPAPSVRAEPAPTEPVPDVDVEAVLLLVERSPEDLAGGRDLLASLAGRTLHPDQEQRRRALAQALEVLATRRGKEHLAQVRREAAALRDRGEIAAMREALAQWPPELSGLPEAREAEQLAEEWTHAAVDPARALIRGLRDAVRKWSDVEVGDPSEVEAWVGRAQEALALPGFPVVERAELEALAGRLDAWRERAVRHAAERHAATLLDRLAQAAPGERATLLASLASDPAAAGSAASQAAARLVREADACEAKLAQVLRDLQGRVWAGVVGGVLRVERVASLPHAIDVMGTVLTVWDPVHPWVPDLEDVVALVGDAAQVDAWLYVRGAPGTRPLEASLAALRRGRAQENRGETTATAPPEGLWQGLQASLAVALRANGAPLPVIEASGDPALVAWVEALRRRPARPRTDPHPLVERARTAFLGTDVAAAWRVIQEARAAQPRSAEVALLASMLLTTACEPLPQRATLLVALVEARRAWDLDPGLRLAPIHVAELGLRLLARAPEGLARRLVSTTQAAAEAALRLGHEPPSLVLFLSERWQQEDRLSDALRVLRASNERHPADTSVLLELARAEERGGDGARALEALERAKELLGPSMPDWAAEARERLRRERHR